jgi:hypothetical protein
VEILQDDELVDNDLIGLYSTIDHCVEQLHEHNKRADLVRLHRAVVDAECSADIYEEYLARFSPERRDQEEADKNYAEALVDAVTSLIA